MYFKLCLFSILFICSADISAQNISIIEPPLLKDLLERHVELNKQREFVKGWRVQILATTNRIELEKSMNNFNLYYPEIPVNWVHEKPWYKLRAGAFSTKLETAKLMFELKERYPGAYPTKDSQVRPNELMY